MPNVGQLTPKGQRTRERIIEVAADLMLRQGFAATTLDDVKAAAGVGSSQLYHYFEGKADLVQAIIARHTELIVARHEDDVLPGVRWPGRLTFRATPPSPTLAVVVGDTVGRGSVAVTIGASRC